MNRNIKATLISIPLSLTVFSSPAVAEATHACEASSPETLAKHFNVDASGIEEAEQYQSREGKTTECQWRFVDDRGHQVFVNYRIIERSEKIKSPDFFENNLARLIQNGRTVGSKTTAYQKADLAGITTGGLSDVYGNRFTKTLSYDWHEGEERRKIVSLARNINDEGELPEPSIDELNSLLVLFQ